MTEPETNCSRIHVKRWHCFSIVEKKRHFVVGSSEAGQEGPKAALFVSLPRTLLCTTAALAEN